MTTEPTEPSGQKPRDDTESQQQLARELEEIAATQLKNPDGDTVVFYDQEKPENVTNPDSLEQPKQEFERSISEIQQSVFNAMVDFSQRMALINTEAQGEEHLAIDVQFTKTIQAIRDKVIDRVPELADQCWKISNDAREGELASMERLDRVVDDARKVVLDTGQRTTQDLGGLKQAVNEDASDQQINNAVSGADRILVGGLQYTEKELSRVPKFYGEVEGHLTDMVRAYARLLNAADRPLSDEEQDEFNKFFKERSDAFLAQLESKVRHERGRISNISDAMHEYYDKGYRPSLEKPLDNLGRSARQV